MRFTHPPALIGKPVLFHDPRRSPEFTGPIESHPPAHIYAGPETTNNNAKSNQSRDRKGAGPKTPKPSEPYEHPYSLPCSALRIREERKREQVKAARKVIRNS